jgi:hypothetical protein
MNNIFQLFCIIECVLLFEKAPPEIKYIKYDEISLNNIGINKKSVLNYLKEKYTNAYSIQIIDVLYFENEIDCDSFLDLKN